MSRPTQVFSSDPKPTAAAGAARGASERLACLLDVARVINSSLDLDRVLEHILSQARAILGAESGSIMLLKEEHLCVLAAQGPRARGVRGKRQRLGEGVAGWVAQHGEPLLLHGPATDARFRRVCERQDVRDALCVPLRAEDGILGVMSVNNRVVAGPFGPEDLELMIALSHQAAVAIRNAWAYQEVQRQRSTVEGLLGEVTRAHEQERIRISNLIHDGPAQTLYSALRYLETARATARQEPVASSMLLGEVEQGIRSAVTEIRSLMVDLRPPCLDTLGLGAALRQYGRLFEQRTGIRVEVSQGEPDRRLPATLESCLYRIAVEAMTNVWKHAAASLVTVTLDVAGSRVRLEVKDNGRGIAPRDPAEEGQHLGMRLLRERAELVGGTCRVISAPGKGTAVRVTAPLRGEDASALG